MKNIGSNKTGSTNDKETIWMPTMEAMDFEKTAYIKGMEEYLKKGKFPETDIVAWY